MRQSNRELTPASSTRRSLTAPLLKWPRNFLLLSLLLGLLYLPVLRENVVSCLRSDDFTYCLLIPPISLVLVWMRREEIASAVQNPQAIGLIWMTVGLVIMTFSYLLHISFFCLWSLIPTLAGAVLALHGVSLWRLTRFPILYLLLAGPIPTKIYFPVSFLIQTLSTRGAALMMQALGYTILQTGNQIEIPGFALEVADVCSGFQKLIALNAFALVYGFMFPISWRKRLFLMLAAYPIAVLANMLRIAALICVVSAGGLPAFRIAHQYADLVALAISFGLFILLGKLIGCKRPRFYL